MPSAKIPLKKLIPSRFVIYTAIIICIILIIVFIVFMTTTVIGRIDKIEPQKTVSLKKRERNRIILTVTYIRKNGSKRTVKVNVRKSLHYKVGDNIKIRVLRMYA